MQLTGEARCAHTRRQARLSPFTRTLLTLGYRRGWDRIYEDRKDSQTQQIVTDTIFYNGRPATADHRGYSLSLSQILTRNAILGFNYELLTDQGYLANPYRKIRYLSPGTGAAGIGSMRTGRTRKPSRS